MKPATGRERRAEFFAPTIHETPINFCEDAYFSVNASKLLEMSKVSGVSQGPCATPALCPRGVTPFPHSPPTPTALSLRPRGAVGSVAPSIVSGAGADPRRKVSILKRVDTQRFPPALPPGLTVRSLSRFLCCKGREYFAPEDLNLPPLPSGAEISPLPP